MLFPILSTWLELLALTFWAGTLLCRLWIPEDRQRLNSISLWAVAAVATTTLITLPHVASQMSGVSLRAAFPLIPAVILRTHFGQLWLLRSAALLWAASAMLLDRRNHGTRCTSVATLLCLLVVAMAESATGHAADAGDFTVRELMHWLHLVACLAWGGGLFILSLVILPRKVDKGDGEASDVARVAARFSAVAGISVCIIAGTAWYTAARSVERVDALLQSPYGLLVVTKGFLFVILLGLGGFNRFVGVPLLRVWSGYARPNRGMAGRLTRHLVSPLLPTMEGSQVARRFLNRMRMEALLVAGVLLCAASLRHEAPARHLSHLEGAGAAGSHTEHHH